MLDLFKAISKIFKHEPKQSDNVTVARGGKHSNGKQRPLNFDAKRKTRRKMADASRKINRRK